MKNRKDMKKRIWQAEYNKGKMWQPNWIFHSQSAEQNSLKYERSTEENFPKVNDSFWFRSQEFYQQWWHFNIFAFLHIPSAEALGINASGKQNRTALKPEILPTQ